MRILIFGGDERQIFAAKYLKDTGADVRIFAVGAQILSAYGSEELLTDSYRGYDVIVFPLPFSVDGEKINCPFGNTSYNAVDLFKNIGKGTVLFAGMAGSFFKKAAYEFGLDLKDYYESEDFQISNAVPTAEGAIWTYMNNSKQTVFDSEFVVTGCGKVAKCLADRLYKLGGGVTIAARANKDLAWARSMGMKAVSIESLLKYGRRCDCIFNTVPCNIFDEGSIKMIGKKTVYIELASKPYGMSEECETILGKRLVHAPSLPGKTAPESAGKIITETIANYL